MKGNHFTWIKADNEYHVLKRKSQMPWLESSALELGFKNKIIEADFREMCEKTTLTFWLAGIDSSYTPFELDWVPMAPLETETLATACLFSSKTIPLSLAFCANAENPIPKNSR